MEKKILKGITALFFIIMIVFTFVSRDIGLKTLPKVETVYAEDNEILPATAVYTDEEGINYVYVLMEEESILGTVTVAKELSVEIKARNGDEVILEGVSEMSHLPYVKDVSVGIEDGDRVREDDHGRA